MPHKWVKWVVVCCALLFAGMQFTIALHISPQNTFFISILSFLFLIIGIILTISYLYAKYQENRR